MYLSYGFIFIFDLCFQLLELSLFLLYLFLFCLHQYLQFCFFVLQSLKIHFKPLQLNSLFGKFFLNLFELITNQNLSFRLHDDCVLNFIELSYFLIFFEIICVKFDSFATHPEEIKQSHFVDKFGCIVRVKKNVFSKFAPV